MSLVFHFASVFGYSKVIFLPVNVAPKMIHGTY